jgi:hypothetical protein
LISHNAGGAALLAAWAAHHAGEYEFTCLLSGPAVTIFCQRLPNAYLAAQNSVELTRYNCVITSTSAAETGWETVWLARARVLGVKTISLLDHWTNYLSRFLWHNEYIFPDTLWVCDAYGLALTQLCRDEIKHYPAAQQIPNFYLIDQSEYIKNNRPKIDIEGHILFVSEPSYNPLYTAESVLEEFLHFISAENINCKIVRLRLHPREQPEDYRKVCVRWAEQLIIELSPNSRLEDDLCWASWVVGCQTMAMVVALAAGIKVSSCLPACVEKSALPHKEIPRLFNLETSVERPKAM